MLFVCENAVTGLWRLCDRRLFGSGRRLSVVVMKLSRKVKYTDVKNMALISMAMGNISTLSS